MTLGKAPESAGGPPPGERRGNLSRSLVRLALWAGPVGLGLALAVLLASAASGHFRSGPGVPTAGDSRAWTAMWGALGLTVLGTSIGALANTVWLVVALRASRPLRATDWLRLAVHTGLGALLWWAMGAG